MKRTKKLLALLLTAVLMLLTAVPVFAADTGFSDIPANAWYEEAVEYVREQGMMSGTGGGAFTGIIAKDESQQSGRGDRVWHSQVSTTLDIYIHAFNKQKRAASAVLQESLEI